MSRSRWAWTKSHGLVSAVVRRAGRLARRELRARPGDGLRVRTVSSLTPLSWVATAVMLMLICSPAGALGKVGSPHSRASAASDTRRASRTAGVTPKPHPRRAIDGPTRPHAELLAFGTGYSATARLERRQEASASPDAAGLLARSDRRPVWAAHRTGGGPLSRARTACRSMGLPAPSRWRRWPRPSRSCKSDPDTPAVVHRRCASCSTTWSRRAIGRVRSTGGTDRSPSGR